MENMKNEKMEKLNKLLEMLQNDTVTPKELEKFLVMVLDVIKKSKDNLESISQENLNTIKESISYIEERHSEVLRDVSKETKAVKDELASKIKELNIVLTEVKKLKDGIDGLDGKDADEEIIVEKVLAKIPKSELQVIEGEDIVNKINSLPTNDEDLKIQATHIKGLTNFVQKTGGTKNLYQLLDVSFNNLISGQVPIYNSTTQLWENGTVSGGSGITYGGSVGGGNPNEVLFIDPSGDLLSSPFFTFNNATNLFTVSHGSYPTITSDPSAELYALGDYSQFTSSGTNVGGIRFDPGNWKIFGQVGGSTQAIIESTPNLLVAGDTKSGNPWTAYDFNSQKLTAGASNYTGLLIDPSNAGDFALGDTLFASTGVDNFGSIHFKANNTELYSSINGAIHKILTNNGLTLFIGDNDNAASGTGLFIEYSTNRVQVTTPLFYIGGVTYNWPGSQGGANTFLKNDGSGNLSWASAGTGTVTSVSGTTNRITVATGTTTPAIDISASYVGQTSITTLGTIGTGTWNGTTIAIAKGGTGQTTANAAFNALSPMTTGGDIIYGGASGVGTRLPNGTNGQVLTSSGGTTPPTWTTPGTGTVTGTGVSGRVTYWNGTSSITSASTFLFDGTNLGIGAAPDSLLTVSRQATIQTAVSGSTAHFVGLDANPLRFTLDTHNTGTAGTAFMFRRSRGTSASPTAVSSGDTIGSLNALGYGAIGYAAASTGLISFKATENFTDTAMGTAAVIFTTPTGSVTAAESARFLSTGLNLGVTGTLTGTLGLSGATSGTVTIQPQSAAGTYNFNLPTTAGSSGNLLTSAGGGSSPMTWLSLGTGIATWLTTPSSANLASAVTDETGSGGLVFANTPTLVTPVLGAATYTTLNGGAITDSSLTAGRITFAGTAGLLSDSSSLNWDNTNAFLKIGTGTFTGGDFEISKTSGAGLYNTISVFNSTTSGGASFNLGTTATARLNIFYNGSTASGNYIGSIPNLSTAIIRTITSSSGALPVLINGNILYGITGSTTTNIGYRQDVTGLRIDAISALHTSNSNPLTVVGKTFLGTNTTATAVLHIGAGATGANSAPIKLSSGSLQTTAEAGTKEYNGSHYETNASAIRMALGGSIVDYFTDVTVGGAETDIYTKTLPANTFNVNGEKVIASYSGNFVTVGTQLTQLKVKFAGTTIWDSTGVAPTTGTTSWRVYVELIRVSSTVIRYSVSLNTTGASGFVYETSGELTGLTLSGTNILKITGTSSGVGSGSGDIIGKMGYIRWDGGANL